MHSSREELLRGLAAGDETLLRSVLAVAPSKPPGVHVPRDEPTPTCLAERCLKPRGALVVLLTVGTVLGSAR